MEKKFDLFIDKDSNLDANIVAMNSSMPIRFAHHKSIDRPENHVLHINNYLEIYFFISGNHRFVVENSLYELKYGDIIIINPREVHKALPLNEHMYERFYFLVNCNTFDTMYLNPISIILNKPTDIGNLISLDSKSRDRVINTLYEIDACFRDKRNDQIRALGLFLQIIDDINQYLLHLKPTSGDVTHTPKLLKDILAYISENTADIDSVADIATTLGVTPQYLSSYFSKYIGTPIKVYVQAKKIALAKHLLDKGADVTQACYDCGFNDCSYFIRVFKKYVGMTPMSYKKSNR